MPNIKVEPRIPNYPPQGIQAQLDLLYLWNPDVANDLIDQINTALEEVGKDLDNYLTKAEAAATYATQTEVTQLSGALEEVSNKVDTVDNDLKELGNQTANIQQDVNTLKTDVAGKASKDANFKTAITDTNKGLTEADAYTKEEVDAKVSSVYRFRGSVATYNNLPTEGNVQGDVWNVEDTGANYAWDGTKWDKLSETIDLTPYLTKEDAASTYATITTVNGKQDALTAEQLAAVNSGITAAKVASYDAYADEISTAQSTADKADNAAEVAQQTANLAGQEAAQALTALAGKVNVAQGADNAGKVMTVGEDGNLAPAAIPAQPSGGIVWDKSVDLANADSGQYLVLLNVGQLTPGHYRFYLKTMLLYGDYGGGPLYQPFTSAVDFYINVDSSQFFGSVSPVLDSNTVLSDNNGYPTEFISGMNLNVYINNTDKKVFFYGDSYFGTWVDQGISVPDLFQVSKIKNLDTGEEWSVESLNYSTQPPEDAAYFGNLQNIGIRLDHVLRPTKAIRQIAFDTSPIYGVYTDPGWAFVNPEQKQQYASIENNNVGFGEFLVCLAERNLTALEFGDMLVIKLTLTPTNAKYERIYSSGKFANWTPFIEKTSETDEYSRLTIRNSDKSPIQLSDGYYLTSLISFYGQSMSSSPVFQPSPDALNFFDTYEIPEKESAQALPDQTGNAGKFLTTDGTNASWGEVQAAAITTDATLTGTGTTDSPLGIAQSVQESIDGKVSKSGDTMTGTLNLATDTTIGAFTIGNYRMGLNGEQLDLHYNTTPVFSYNPASGLQVGSLQKYFGTPSAASGALGSNGNQWFNVYTEKLNNGADIVIPTTGGTMALLSDIPDISNLATKAEVQQEIQDAIGTIETALAEV